MAEDDIRDILRLFNYGLFIVTSAGPRAATVSWAMQASLEPRLVAVGLRKGTAIYEAVRATQRFGLHLVGQEQAELARAFFHVSQSDAGQIAGQRYSLTPRGVPLLDAAIAWLECEVAEEANAQGDHGVFIARILDGGIRARGAQALALRDTVWHYGG
ncbi:MAG: 4-nitrophenol 4-monooxygenase/4-nitrocatechol 2-monooxygenase, reductase component [Chloroflexi bacterium ADurb.Bin325]|nr:MAG: 4-nitrophenol 4-monooxygenase/4-nitrocatechol 2-monooxygenase, reductase component [Chloroflexi bacterium ADurb.Bin325]